MSKYADLNGILEAGGVALLPTETVYGLACLANNSQAVDRIYALKGRTFQKPLAVCVQDIDMARAFGLFSPKAIALAERYWPGSLTLIVEAKPGLHIDAKCQSMSGGTPTIAFRCPEADWLPALNGPLALTSANRSGEKDCVSYAESMAEFAEEIDGSLRANVALSGLPSTIVSVLDEEIKILRQGTLEVTL